MSWVQELHRRAYEDPGTGLWKQSFLTDELNNILEPPSALFMLKPDQFKVLVDSRGHGAGDEAMIRIAQILKNMARKTGRGWPLRFKSNEVGLLINKCTPALAEQIARELAQSIKTLTPVPAQGDIPAFSFSASLSYGLFPGDDPDWESFFQGNYGLLMDTWKDGGNCIVHYSREVKNGSK
jgi:diguanylate cyclase (GGDEF)-like protein